MSDHSPTANRPRQPAVNSDSRTNSGGVTAPGSQRFGKRSVLPSVPPPLPGSLGSPAPDAQSDADGHPRRQPWPLQQSSASNDRAPATAESPAPNRPENIPDMAPDSSRQPNSRRTSSRFAGIGYAATGFVAGAAFWHAVGFWTLVHDAVFSGPRLEAQQSQSQYANSPPVVRAFDEEVLRYANDPANKLSPARITTGSVNRSKPNVHTKATAPNDRPALAQPPPANSWQPAVNKTPGQ
ncbi:MAG: hypothetical protein K0U74_11120 [Alphaproteobacteria bacterium]|nr:hypothetical protein [Alphaproteobacteria bacterium]